jgi:signal transduction histidine kinase
VAVRRVIARLPTRVRVTLAFAAVMAVLLTALGSFIYLRLRSSLDASVDRGLRSRSADLVAVVQQAGADLGKSGESPLTRRGETLAQVLDRGGTVIDAPPALRRTPLLERFELARALRGATTVEHETRDGDEDPVRLLARPVTSDARRLVVVVGASLEPNRDALQQLGGLLVVGGLAALALASLAGYGAAAGALRPVEHMRRRAQAIGASRLGARLPVPPASDEVGRLGATLNEMLDRLEAAFTRERRFVADASHELRTPLAILHGELELALRDADDVEGFREAVTSAVEEADRLNQLAEDLLVIARTDQGELPVRLEDLDAGVLLSGVGRRFAQRAGGHGVQLDTQAPADLGLRADQLRLEQALGNMVDNALRHGEGRVELLARVDGERVELHVLDDGPGFPEEFLAGAFERFTRADSARGRGGAGLGLAIVRAIAEAHGGTAHARNRPDGGADVWLDLPRAATPAMV